MKKKIQLTGIVKEDSVNVEYETGKHDSISSAEAELLTMIDYTQSGPFPVNVASSSFNCNKSLTAAPILSLSAAEAFKNLIKDIKSLF